MISTQFNVKVQFLKSDNKYMDGGFQSYMLEHGILHQTSVNTPIRMVYLSERTNTY